MKKMIKEGFTLVEIMIVVAIIGLLAAIGIPSILGAYKNAQDNTKKRNIANVEKAKGILTLPSGSSVGAIGYTATNLDATANAELLKVLKITNLTELVVGGTTIQIGDMTSTGKATY